VKGLVLMNWWRGLWERFWLRYINRQPSPTCQEVLRLLANRENWVLGPHVMVHKTSFLGIWIANKDYGLHLVVGAKIHSDGSTTTSDGHNVELSSRDKKAIYKAINVGAYDQAKADMVKLYWELKKHK